MAECQLRANESCVESVDHPKSLSYNIQMLIELHGARLGVLLKPDGGNGGNGGDVWCS